MPELFEWSVVVDGEVIEVLAEQRRVGEVIYLDDWYVGDDYVGRTDRNYFRRQNPVIDVLMYPISPNVTSSRIYITSTATRAVVRRAFLSEIGINNLVCVSASSQTVGKCGYIWLEREDIQIGTVIHRDAYCLDAGSTQFQQGDSGSPVYKIASGDDNRAYGAGILAFFYNTLDGPMGECFHTIYDIERESGLTLGVIP